jgi:subtilisin family serine protease
MFTCDRLDQFGFAQSLQRGTVVSLCRLRSVLPTIVATLLVATIVLGGIPSPIAPPAVAGNQQGEKQRDVIVVLKRGTDPGAVARGAGAKPTHVYEHVIDGFAASLPPQAIRGLENHPQVVAVVPDQPVEAFASASPDGDGVVAEVSPAPRKCKKIENKKKRQQCIKRAKQHERASTGAPPTPIAPPASGSVALPPPVEQPPQALPTGIDRIDADGNPVAQIDGLDERIEVDVAVLDTGIAAHPDLKVAGGASCLGQNYADDNGHGTHAAGTVGALDNSIGVVGVAPGARLWAVKVLDARGEGYWSSVICGLDWVYARRSTIDVVNLSLGGNGSETTCSDPADPLHGAICRVVNQAGIPVVVAAGNAGKDAATTVPATYDEVIAVSAFADSDGAPGGRGPSRCGTNDDTFATFSNFGADVDIAAPGACIRSTSRGSGYEELSGTSMAAPHVTGAVSLYLAENPAATPSDVRGWLLGTASRPQNSSQGFSADRDTVHEPALYLGTT